MKYNPRKGVIAAGDELTAQAGYEILRAGGNAYDSALAATLMSFVASSTITSLGGGGFMISRNSNNKVFLLDFFTQTPVHKRKLDNPEFFPVTVDFGDKTQEFHVGTATAATPGNLAGIWEIYNTYCTLPFSDLIAPATEAARKGYRLHAQTKYQTDILKPILGLSPTGREIYFDKDETKPLGGIVRMPEFANFLEFLALEGPREFYEGEIARMVADDNYNLGGHLTREDFLQYKPEYRDALKINYRDHTIYTTNFPNAGGPLIGFTLTLLNSTDMEMISWGKAEHILLLKESIDFTTRVRKNFLNKNIHGQNLESQLFSHPLIKDFKKKADSMRGKPGNTTHVSVADEDLNFVGITTSVGEGCGYYIPGTQIMLNNMLGEEDLNPWGFHEWPENSRMSSMMSPTLVMEKKKPRIMLGSGGSNRIRSAIVQTISNYVDYHMSPDECVNASRIHWENNHLDIEPGYDIDEIDTLNLGDHSEKIYWTAKNMYFGGVHAVFLNENDELIPAGDRRRVGAIRISL